MQIGDLVELSTRGSKLDYCRHARGKIGVVIDVKSEFEVFYPIRVSWMGGKATAGHLRTNLKFISKI